MRSGFQTTTVLTVPSKIARCSSSKAGRLRLLPLCRSSNHRTEDARILWPLSQARISAFWLSFFCPRAETRQ